MINNIKTLIVFSVTFILSCFVNIDHSNAQSFLRASGKKIVNERNENILLRGIGLGGWMLQEGYMLGINNEGQQHKIKQRITNLIGEQQTKVFYNNWLSNHTRKADIDSMKAWGFNSVRLPMHYNLYTLSVEEEPVKGQNTWLEKGFSMTDSLLAWCKANKMYLILDLHAAPGGQGNDFNISDRDPSKPSLWDSEANQQKTIALWRKLAERYVNEPWIGAYDILNEPNWGFEDSTNDKNGIKEKQNIPLRKLMVNITKAIREVDQKHIVIIEGNGWGNNYNGIFPLWDNNIVLSFHKYWAYNDQASAKGMITVRDEQNVPVWLGETGENSNVWFTEAIRLFEKNNIGWAWWPLKKLGNNNPIEVKSNHEYDEILNYWKGDGAKPSTEVAKSGLMKLADNLKVENGIVHYDVIDAMIRQPFSNETKPFKNNVVKNQTTIYAVDYDLGINGMAYFDKDTADYHVSTGVNTVGNRGRVYRNDGVDISKGPQNSYYISNIETDEWLQYTIDVATSGTYTIELNLASKDTNGRLSVAINGKPLGQIVNVPNTRDYNTFKTIQLKNIKLSAGKQKLRIFANAGGFNFNYIRFIE